MLIFAMQALWPVTRLKIVSFRFVSQFSVSHIEREREKEKERKENWCPSFVLWGGFLVSSHPPPQRFVWFLHTRLSFFCFFVFWKLCGREWSLPVVCSLWIEPSMHTSPWGTPRLITNMYKRIRNPALGMSTPHYFPEFVETTKALKSSASHCASHNLKIIG